MSQKPLPKWCQHFLRYGKPFSSKKLKNFEIFLSYDFVQIQKRMERFYTSDVSVSNGNIKGLVGKSIFAENLPLQLFHSTVANADTESLRPLHTLFDTYLDHMLAKFEPNCVVRNVQSFELFDKKSSF